MAHLEGMSQLPAKPSNAAVAAFLAKVEAMPAVAAKLRARLRAFFDRAW